MDDNTTQFTFQEILTSENFACTNSSNFIFESKIDVLRTYLLIIQGFIWIFGIAGNTLAVLVLRTDKSAGNPTFMLQLLAIVDNGFLICSMIGESLEAFCHVWTSVSYIYHYSAAYLLPVISTAHTSSQWVLVLAAIERHLVVGQPHSPHSRTIRRVAVFIPVIAAIYNIPKFLEFETAPLWLNCGQPRCILIYSPFGTNRLYYLIYNTILSFIFRAAFPLVVLLHLNRKLHKSLSSSHRNMPGGPNLRRLTLLLVVIISVFIFCHVPDVLSSILSALTSFGVLDLGPTMGRLTSVSNLFLIVNSASNFYIYCIAGRGFRLRTKRMIFKPCK